MRIGRLASVVVIACILVGGLIGAYKFAILAAYHTWTTAVPGTNLAYARKWAEIFSGAALLIIMLETLLIVWIVKRLRSKKAKRGFPVIDASSLDDHSD